MKRYIILILVTIFIPFLTHADTGPKPSVDIDYYYEGKKIEDDTFNAEMLSCNDEEREISDREEILPQLNILEYDDVKKCFWQPAPLAWGGKCKNSSCRFNYFPPTEFRIATYIPSLDKVFITTSTVRENFRSYYDISLYSDGEAYIVEKIPATYNKTSLVSFFLALFFTLVIELLVAWAFLRIFRVNEKVLNSVAIGSIITLPIIWFVFSYFLGTMLAIIFGEFFAFITEGLIIYFMNKSFISLKKSFALSFIINSSSLFFGGYLLAWTSIIFGIS